MIKNIVFDIGDVLVEFRWMDFLMDKGLSREMAERIGEASVKNAAWIELDRGVWYYEQVLESFVEKDMEIAEEIRLAFRDMKDIVVPQMYTKEWLEGLKAQGYQLYYLSNWSERLEKDCAEALAFRYLMDGGILSWHEQVVKPSPDIYQLLMERYALVPQECVFIDDRAGNVEQARRMGMYGICFSDYNQTRQELETLLTVEKGVHA